MILNDAQALVRVYRTRGEVEARWGHPADSVTNYTQAAELAQEIGSVRDAAHIFADQGAVLERSGYTAESIEAYERALRMFQDAGDEREAKRVGRALERVRPKQDE